MFSASGLRDPVRQTTSAPMISREQWRAFIDHPVVEWGIFVVGILFMIAAIPVGALPGPGGVFVFAIGLAMVLKTSMWAKRRYVRFKRQQPKVGRWTDWGLRRRSHLRRERLRKEREALEAAQGDQQAFPEADKN
jgi:hypothetical protein